jgi:hypothetical protein
MLQDSILVWKLLSLLFFFVLLLFFLYIILEKSLNKIEFKKRLKLVKDQLVFDIFKDNISNTSDFILMDSFSEIEIETRDHLKNLKKDVFCEISRYDLKDLESKINNSSKERENKFNQIILGKYKDAIKSLNDKIIYLKTDLDVFKSFFYDSKIDIDNKLYDYRSSNDMWLESSIRTLEKNLENKFFGSLQEKDKYIKQQIEHMVQTNQKNSIDKINLISDLKDRTSYEEISKKLYESNHNNYVKLKSSITDIEKSLTSRLDSIIKDRDNYIQRQIDYLIKNNDRVSIDNLRVISQLQDKSEVFMRENIEKVYELLKEKERILTYKDETILEQKSSIFNLQKSIFEQKDFINNKIREYSLDKKYLDQYINAISQQNKIQNLKNIFFIVSIVSLFLITLVMFILVLTKSPIIYTMY